jgi:DNA-binding transcriptional ArsR family regulator
MPTITPTPSTNGHSPAGQTSEARIAKALAHPLRARILQRLGERVASPGDLAVELGAPLGVVSYHVRMLRDYECVELVRTEPRRGALQHFYKATARPNLDENQWRTLPSGLRRELTGETIQGLVDDLGQAADAGTLDDPEVVLSRTPMELDERGWKKLNKLMAKTLDQALAIAAESSARRNEGSSDGVFPTEVGILHFRRAQTDATGS